MRKFKIAKVTDWRVLSGTSLQGYVNVDYSTLVRVFGNPEGSIDPCKSDCAWDLNINGVVCTIYNYKDGKNYNGPSGLDKEYITEWHVGGRSKQSAKMVEQAIEQHFATV